MSDDDVVAWVDAADAGTLSVLDLATGDRVDVPVADLPGEPVSRDARDGSTAWRADIAAVDGRTVYVTDARGVLAWDALDGEDPVLLPAPDGVEVQVLEVEDGEILQVARSFEPQEVDGATTMVQVDGAPPRARPRRHARPAGHGRSAVPGRAPGGALRPGVAARRRQLLHDRGRGRRRQTRGRRSHRGATTASSAYQWLDADTFAASAGIYTDDVRTCRTC